ncbi:hypothetical protein V8E36_004829 [Tilletia maclaganii]
MASFDMVAQPLALISEDQAFAVRQLGLRKCWPTAEYDFSSVPDRLFGSPADPGLRILSRILDQAHQVEYDLRGAGPNFKCFHHEAPQHFKSQNFKLTPLATCLIPLDLGLNPFAARQLLLDGHLYGRLLFPLLPTSPPPHTSPPPTPYFPQETAGTTNPAASLVDPLQLRSPLSPRLDPPDGPAASVDPLPPQAPLSLQLGPPNAPAASLDPLAPEAPLSPKLAPPDSPTLCIEQAGPRTLSQPPLHSPGSLRTPPHSAAPLTSAPSTLSRQEFLDVTLQDAYIEGVSTPPRSLAVPPAIASPPSPMLAPLETEERDRCETATSPGLCQAPSGLAFQNPTPPAYVETSGSEPFQPPAYWQDFSRYTAGQPLSAGCQGQVVACHDQLTGSRYVIKWARNDKSGRPPNTMLREIHALRKTQHQNILFLQAVLYDRERVALILPCAVQDMKTAIIDNRRHGLEVGIVKLYTSQLLKGLAWLHDQLKIVHLDIKPDNLLLNADHRLRIRDFGLARDMGDAGRQRTVVTMAYRAPEVFFRTGKFDGAVDMFAVGVVLQEMLGAVPWARLAYQPLICFEEMLDTLGCGIDELWPGSDRLPGVWHGDDGVGDDPYFLAKKGHVRFKPRARRVSQLPHIKPYKDVKPLLQLRDRLLQLDPARRPTARSAYHDAAFSEPPRTASFGALPALVVKNRPPVV